MLISATGAARSSGRFDKQMANTTNLKAINEYKRVLRQVLDAAGLKGVPLKGFSRWTGKVMVRARASINISFSCDGQQLEAYNYSTRKKDTISLADPVAIETLKNLFKADFRRLTEGQ